MKLDKEDYILKVSAGKDYDSLSVVEVNDEENPAYINSSLFSGYLLVRIADFDGVTKRMDRTKEGQLHFPIADPPSGYFSGRNRRYSIAVQGRFKHSYDGDDVLFGIDSDKPLSPPTGISMALRISKWLDPTLEADLSGDCPHMYSPLVSGINALAVFGPNEKVGGKTIGTGSSENICTGAYLGSPVSNPSTSPTREVVGQRESNVTPASTATMLAGDYDSPLSTISDSPLDSLNSSLGRVSIDTDSPLDCQTWAFGSNNVPDKSALLFSTPSEVKHTHPYQKRKSYLTKPALRKRITLSPENFYAIDFYDCYFQHSTFQLHLPGFSLDGFYYWDGCQQLRYVCKKRSGEIFFVVSFEWVLKDSYPGLD